MGNEVSGPVSAAAEAAETPTVSSPPSETQAGATTEHGREAFGTRPSALVLVGPSGVGKNTLIKQLVEGSDQFGFSISHTTRQPRPGEKHGKEYYFISKELFCREIAEGKFLEYAEVHGRLYGTSQSAVQHVLNEGRVCILDVDVQGARSLRKAVSTFKAIFVFIAPPSLEDLARRLAGRGSESAEQIRLRMENAKAEIHSLNEKGLYDYLVINDDLEEASAKLRQIAARAAQGMDPEPGQVPETVIIEEAPLPDLSELIREQQSLSSELDHEVQPGTTGDDIRTEQLHLEQEQEEHQMQQQQEALLVAQEDHEMLAEHGLLKQQQAQLEEQLEQRLHIEQQQGCPDSAPIASATEAASANGPSRGAAAADPGAANSPRPEYPSPIVASSSGSAPAAPPAEASGMEKWMGKVVLVTGASSGIGAAVCEALALAGMRVVAVARRKDRLEQLQQRMHRELRVPVSSFLPVVCDVTKDAEVATLPRIVTKRWPDHGIDVLVNNAGMSRNDASLFEGNVSSWVEMLSTNVLGTAMCTRAVVQDMLRRGTYGHIINMVGLSGHRIPDGPQGGGFYCGTKAAVKMMTEGLRQEARGRGVPLRVSAISPGMVETEFFAVRAFGDDDAASQATSVFKCLEPTDVAQAIVWCLSAPDHVEVNDVVVRPSAQLI